MVTNTNEKPYESAICSWIDNAMIPIISIFWSTFLIAFPIFWLLLLIGSQTAFNSQIKDIDYMETS